MTIRRTKHPWKTLLIVVGIVGMSFAGLAQAGRGGNGKKTFGTVYVNTQGLYFDTFAAADALPMKDHFRIFISMRMALGKPTLALVIRTTSGAVGRSLIR